MAEKRIDKNGQEYLLMTQEEVEELRAEDAKFATMTPKDHVRRMTGLTLGVPKALHNWVRWAELQRREKRLPFEVMFTAICLRPQHFHPEGEPDLVAIGRARGAPLAPRSIKRHLAVLRASGVDFRRLEDWPDPLL